MDHDRHGARQPHRFHPERAAVLDDTTRFAQLPPAEVLALLDAPTNATVVDFGTGTGTYAIEMVKARPDLHVVAFDEQQPMLDRLAQKLLVAPLKSLEPVLAHTPRADALRAQADRVLALNVFHELGDAALAQALAMVKEGGSAVIIDWNADVPRTKGPATDHLFSPAEAIQRVEKAGFLVSAQKHFAEHYGLVCRRGH